MANPTECPCGRRATVHPHTGIDLIHVRRRARLTVEEVGSRMGVTRQRISNVETRVDRPVTPVFWGRYLAAVDAEVAARSAAAARAALVAVG